MRKFENIVPLFGYLRKIFFVDFTPRTVIGVFFMNHLCDVLWSYSLCWSCILSTKKLQKGIVVALFFCGVNEFAQLSPYICATFDWLDLLYEAFAAMFAAFIFDRVHK